MNHLMKAVTAGAAGMILLGGAPALASGGSGSGGGAAGGGGAAATGGGAATRRGVKDVGAPPTVPCATLPSLSAPVGYYSVWAALWNTYTVRSCATGSETLTVRVTDTNIVTGTIDYDFVMPVALTAGQNSSMVLDNDFAPFDTSYSVLITVTDASGTVLCSSSVAATTPSAR